MLYHPEGLYVWDTWYFERDGKAHCIHLQVPRPQSKRNPRETGALGHAVSEDLVHWQDAGTALYPGDAGTYDDMELWTGSVMEKDGELYMFYTARSSRENGTVNRIALAVSHDGQTWTRYSNNPVITPDGRWYANEERPIRLYGHGHPIVDCRDMCVVKDPDSPGWWGFFQARRHAATNAATSVIGLAYSTDLKRWEQYPPCFKPEGLACVEVPDVFYLNGRWYMLCLTGNGYGQRGGVSDPLVRWATVYAVSDRLQGPFIMDKNDHVLIGSCHQQGYSAKTLLWHGCRTLFYTQGESKAGCTHGSISRPHLLAADDSGHLRAMWHPACDLLYHSVTLDGFEDVRDGRWGSMAEWVRGDDSVHGTCVGDWAVLPTKHAVRDGYAECLVTLEDASAAGVCVRMPGQDVMSGAIVALLDPERGQVIVTSIREFADIEARTFPVMRHKEYRLRIAFTGCVFMVYINDELMIQCFEPWATEGRIALYVEKGSAVFSALHVCEEEG